MFGSLFSLKMIYLTSKLNLVYGPLEIDLRKKLNICEINNQKDEQKIMFGKLTVSC